MEPYRSSVPLNWRLRKSRYNMLGNMCKSSGKVFFPQKMLCDVCNDNRCFENKQISGFGVVETWTIINNTPPGFPSPSTFGIIKLTEGPSITAQIVGKPKIGSRVKMVLRKMYTDGKQGLIYYGYKFQVID